MMRNVKCQWVARATLSTTAKPSKQACLAASTLSDFRNNHNQSVYLSKRHYSLTKQSNSLVIAGLSVAGASVLAKYGVDAYNAFQKERREKAEKAAQEAAERGESPEDSTVNASDATEKTAEKKAKKAAPEEASNPFSKFFNIFGKNYYEGGFDDKMSKREAALILGVRESATVDRIKDAHRRILLNNHPDRGGSAYLATKVNEAKDLLMKTKGTN